MHKIALAFILMFHGITLLGQTSLEFGTFISINDSIALGKNRPRIVLNSNYQPVVIWGKPGTISSVFCSVYSGTSFSPPIKISPDSAQIRVGSYDGPNIAAAGDSIYVAFEQTINGQQTAQIIRSTNGGISFNSPVQADQNLPGEHLEYVGVTANTLGDPMVYYIASDASWANPRHTVVASTDAGMTFGTEVIANTPAQGIPCECCQGSMAISPSYTTYLYRNNISNVRNIYATVSTDGGAVYNSSYELDAINWNINGCPSTGPEGHITDNDILVSAWMNQGTGKARIYYGSLDLSSGNVSLGQMIDSNVISPISVVQNYPSVAGNGDTIGVVWQDNRMLYSHAFFAYSIDGGQSFSSGHIISDTTVMASNYAPHLAFKNKAFHFTWNTNTQVYYRNATIITPSNLGDRSPVGFNVELWPNPTASNLHIEVEDDHNTIYKLRIFNITGTLIYTTLAKSGLNTLNLADLAPGAYLLNLSNDREKQLTKSLFIQ